MDTDLHLTDLNPHGGIAANSWLLNWGPFRFVVDAGMSPKHDGLEAVPRYGPAFAEPLDFVVVTHCHLDHLGSLPILMRQQPSAPILLSRGSHILARRLLHNSCTLMTRQRDELPEPAYPLFTHREIEKLNHMMFPLVEGETKFFHSATGERLALTFHRAGHIPGAVAVTAEYRGRKVMFSGDLLFADQKILRGAQIPDDPVDVLVLETTRGARGRPAGTSRATEITRLLAKIREVHARGGSILIPVFALGRMQELIAQFHAAREAGQLPEMPIYLSGLGVDLADFFDEIAKKVGHLKFRRAMIKELGAVKLPDNLTPRRMPPGPALYLVSSGMMVERTPSHKVAAGLVAGEANAICFVGYCDPDAPGGTLLATAKGEKMSFGEVGAMQTVRAEVCRFDLSSHAEREELRDLAVRLKAKTVVLSHGDAAARTWMGEAITAENPAVRIVDPVPGKAVGL